VSVVLIVRDGARHIAEALGSVLSGERPPDEVLVVDGGSTDATVEVARSFAGVRCVPQEGRGIAEAYNQGIAGTTGELVAFISHDDRWTPRKLAVQTAALARRPELGLVVGRARFFLEEGCAPPPGLRPELLRGDHVARIMETLLVRRATLERVGPFDGRLSPADDVDWYARADGLGVPWECVPEVVLEKRVHGSNASMTRENTARLLEVARLAVARRRAGGGGSA